MSTRKYWPIMHLASSGRRFGMVTGLTLVTALASGCATHTSRGFLENTYHLTPVARCRAGAIEFCELDPGRTPGINQQTFSCSCIDADAFRWVPNYRMNRHRPR